MIFIKTKKELSKHDRILKEDKRLRKIYKDIAADKKAIIDGLISRAAYMRITLEDYEEEINTNGYFELFTQSEKTEPYERERPVARLYNTMNKNYQSIIRQLSDLLPKDNEVVEDDGFDKFLNAR